MFNKIFSKPATPDINNTNVHDILGKQGTDKVTGFTGTVTSHVQYLTGCTQLGLTPRVNEKGETRHTEFFDIARVELSDEDAIDQDDVTDNGAWAGGPNRDAPRI